MNQVQLTTFCVVQFCEILRSLFKKPLRLAQRLRRWKFLRDACAREVNWQWQRLITNNSNLYTAGSCFSKPDNEMKWRSWWLRKLNLHFQLSSTPPNDSQLVPNSYFVSQFMHRFRAQQIKRERVSHEKRESVKKFLIESIYTKSKFSA